MTSNQSTILKSHRQTGREASLVLPVTSVSKQDKATPFIKWAGGKRALVPQILKAFPKEFNDYWEPFVGGGALFFALDSKLEKAHLSDMNADLIRTYQMLKGYPTRVIAVLEELSQKHSRKFFNEIREKYNGEKDPVLLAAYFIYLNKTCFNGLYRVNRKGEFNVPFGQNNNPNICDTDNFKAVSKALKKASVRTRSFEKISPQYGDLVYCDPPYHGTFTKYTGCGFTEEDQVELRDNCIHWIRSGAKVIISNSDTSLIRNLYKDFKINEVVAQRNISSNGNGRGKIIELLIQGGQ